MAAAHLLQEGVAMVGEDAYEGLGILGFLRLVLTFVYCFILSLIPIVAGWVVAYRLWIHKWNWVREILWRDPPQNRVADSRARSTYLSRRQPSLASKTFPTASSLASASSASGSLSSSSSSSSASSTAAAAGHPISPTTSTDSVKKVQ